jgi:putative transposase
MKKMSEH